MDAGVWRCWRACSCSLGLWRALANARAACATESLPSPSAVMIVMGACSLPPAAASVVRSMVFPLGWLKIEGRNPARARRGLPRQRLESEPTCPHPPGHIGLMPAFAFYNGRLTPVSVHHAPTRSDDVATACRH